MLSRADGSIAVLLDRYYGKATASITCCRATSWSTSRAACPLYVLWFKNAALQYRLDWRLLAAMGYQESKWDPAAVSLSGARGLMQMTEDTAALMRFGRPPRPAAEHQSAAPSTSRA